MAEPRAQCLPPIFALLWPWPDKPIAQPGAEFWNDIAAIARQQRLRPLLHRKAQHGGWAVPPAIADNWALADRRAEVRALKQKVELARITRWFAEADIEAYVLKGGALAWRGWFDPAIRPMRDLDLLVRADQAEAAQELLISRGYSGAPVDVVANSKHLPALTARDSGVVVEIHTRMIDAPTQRWAERDARFCQLASERARRLSASEGGFAVFSDEDTLLHLIVHAVLDHQFNNGPVLLLDIEALIAKGQIDWPQFWETADKIGARRAAQLALKLAEAIVPGLTVDWQGHAPQDLDADAVIGAASLMLVPAEKRTQLGLVGRLARFSWSDRIGVVLGGLMRQRRSVTATEPSGKQGDPPEAAAGLSHMLAGARSAAGRAHIKRSLAVAKWLRG